MPYEKEHSARLKNPGLFKEKPDWSKEGGFRRTNGGIIYGSIKIPKSISIIWGQLKTQSGDSAFPQALRFDKNIWSATEAKEWLKLRKIKYILFEKAKE